MRFLAALSVFCLLMAPPVWPGDEAEVTETTVLFTTFDGANGLPLPVNGVDGYERAVGAVCTEKMPDVVNSGFSDLIVGMVLDFAFAETRDRMRDFAESFVRTYAANRNIARFDIPLHGSRCLGVARLKVDKDHKIVGYYSYAILALVRDTDSAFVIRPLYLHTPAMKTAKGAGDPPGASAMLSVALHTIAPDGRETATERDILVEDHQTGPTAAPSVFAFAPGLGMDGGFEPFEDSAYLPYPADRPVSIAVAVTEQSLSAHDTANAGDLIARNRRALQKRLKLAGSGN